MRGVLCMCAALALWAPPAAGREPTAAGREPTAAGREPTVAGREPTAARQPHLHAIRRQILAKLGLSARPTPLRAPPRDVVRQILAHAADPAPPPDPSDTREIIAIAHRGSSSWLPSGRDIAGEHLLNKYGRRSVGAERSYR